LPSCQVAMLPSSQVPKFPSSINQSATDRPTDRRMMAYDKQTTPQI
jgi:hypothetical protein